VTKGAARKLLTPKNIYRTPSEMNPRLPKWASYRILEASPCAVPNAMKRRRNPVDRINRRQQLG